MKLKYYIHYCIIHNMHDNSFVYLIFKVLLLHVQSRFVGGPAKIIGTAVVFLLYGR